MKETKLFVFTIDVELRKKVKIEAAKMDITIPEMMDIIITKYFSGE